MSFSFIHREAALTWLQRLILSARASGSTSLLVTAERYVASLRVIADRMVWRQAAPGQKYEPFALSDDGAAWPLSFGHEIAVSQHKRIGGVTRGLHLGPDQRLAA